MDILSDTKLFWSNDPGGVYKPAASAKFVEGHAVLIVGVLRGAMPHARLLPRALPRLSMVQCCSMHNPTYARPAPWAPGYDDYGQYWIVKQSWGPSFGLGGLVKVAYDATATSIANDDET
jgi:hypothetical protein